MLPPPRSVGLISKESYLVLGAFQSLQTKSIQILKRKATDLSAILRHL